MVNFPGIPKGLSPEQARLYRSFVFLVRLVVLALPLYIIIMLGVDMHLLQLAAAAHSALLLNLMGQTVILQGTGITMGNGFQFFIIDDCTGWKSMILLFALVLAIPGVAMRDRGLALLVGIPLVWAANLARIAGIVQAQSAWGTQTALSLHNTLFQAFMVAVVLVIWLAWLLMQKKGISLAVFLHR